MLTQIQNVLPPIHLLCLQNFSPRNPVSLGIPRCHLWYDVIFQNHPMSTKLCWYSLKLEVMQITGRFRHVLYITYLLGLFSVNSKLGCSLQGFQNYPVPSVSLLVFSGKGLYLAMAGVPLLIIHLWVEGPLSFHCMYQYFNISLHAIWL